MTHFQKRNGTIVPFNIGKIVAAIDGAIRDIVISGYPAKYNSQELAGAVKSELEAKDTDTITYGMVISSLHKVLGPYPELHSAYFNYAEKRDAVRERLSVVDKSEKKDQKVDVTDKTLLLVNTGASVDVVGWDRSKIENKLRKVFPDMPANDIVSIAKRTENRIVLGKFVQITTALIREIVNNELEIHHYPKLPENKMYSISKEFLDEMLCRKSVENSNVSANTPETVNENIAEYVLKNYALDNIFSPEVAEAHNSGRIHIHDLGFAPTRVYCSAHSIEYIKKYGLKGFENLNTESKPARSASVLTSHLNTFLASMQANYAGALGLAYINTLYAPYIVGLDENEVHQIAQELIFNASQNAFSRGSQTIFTDFNIDPGVPSMLKDTPAIHPGGLYKILVPNENGFTETLTMEEEEYSKEGPGGYPLYKYFYVKDGKTVEVRRECYDEKIGFHYDAELEEKTKEAGCHIVTYGDFVYESSKMCSALLRVFKEGDANGKQFFFPKCQFHVSEEMFKDEGKMRLYKEACDLAAHNGSTYFVFDRSAVTLSACCRLLTTIDDTSLLKHPERLRFSFPRNETLVVRGPDKVEKVTSFDNLFTTIGRNNSLAVEEGNEIYETDDYEILDNGKWTKLHRILRHKKVNEGSKTLIAFQTADGRLKTMTSNHPVLLNEVEGAHEARAVGPGSAFPFVGEFYDPTTATSALTDEELETETQIIRESLMANQYCFAFSTTLLHYNWETFIRLFNAFVGSDGISVYNEETRTLVITTTAKTALDQIQMVLMKNRRVSAMMLGNDRIDGRITYVLTIPNTIATVSPDGSFYVTDFEKIESSKPLRYDNVIYRTEIFRDDEEEWVYDVTTETHTFVVNGFQLHNCGFANTTTSLPHAAYLAKMQIEKDPSLDIENVFLKEVDKSMDLSVQSHMEKKAHIAQMMAGPGRPLWQVGKIACDGQPYINLDKCTYILGIIGLNEAVKVLYGHELHESDEMQDKGLRIIAHMNLRLKEYTEKYHLKFSIEETPAESAARRFARADLIRLPDYAEGIVKGSEDAEYYTNSIHLTADAPVVLVERIRKQSMYHPMIASGAIIHAFIGEEQPSAGAIEEIVTMTFFRTQCAQLTFSPNYTYCNICKRRSIGLHDVCPYCGSDDTDQVTRVVGYFSKIKSWNKSKRFGELVARNRGNYAVQSAD